MRSGEGVWVVSSELRPARAMASGGHYRRWQVSCGWRRAMRKESAGMAKLGVEERREDRKMDERTQAEGNWLDA